MYSTIAWRNIWRNPRRTFVILTAIVIGIWSMILHGSLMRGMEVEMVKNGISTLTGNLRIHHRDYENDPVIENSMTDMPALTNALKNSLPPGARWTERIRVNAVVSNARHSTGVTLTAIDPEMEARVSFIGKSIFTGRYLDPEDTNKIVIGQALLETFETKIGRKLIVMSQDTEQQIASKAFRIVGTFRAEMEATEKQYVFVNLPAAQKMLKLPGGISEISVSLETLEINGGTDALAAAAIGKKLTGTGYSVKTWRQLLPMLDAYLKLADGFIYIWYLVVFIAMGFGIVNTTLMAIFERMREFGLLKAMGMKPWWIIRGVLTESFFLLMTGMAAGNILGFLSVSALSVNGIDLSALAAGVEMWGMPRVLYPAIWIKDVLVANLVVLVLGLVVSIYPAAKAAGFTPVEALART